MKSRMKHRVSLRGTQSIVSLAPREGRVSRRNRSGIKGQSEKGTYMGGDGATLIALYRAQINKSIHFHAGFISYKVITDVCFF